MSTVKDRINEATARAGLSPEQLAKLAGLPELAPMLKGEMRCNLNDDELIEIARLTDADFAWLMSGIEKPLDSETEEAIEKIPQPDREVLRQLFTKCGGPE